MTYRLQRVKELTGYDPVDPAEKDKLGTAADLKKKGVEDFQLDYAIRTLKRLAPKAPSVASAAPKPKG